MVVPVFRAGCDGDEPVCCPFFACVEMGELRRRRVFIALAVR